MNNPQTAEEFQLAHAKHASDIKKLYACRDQLHAIHSGVHGVGFSYSGPPSDTCLLGSYGMIYVNEHVFTAITREKIDAILERHGVNLDEAQEVGSDSTFRISLPLLYLVEHGMDEIQRIVEGIIAAIPSSD